MALRALPALAHRRRRVLLLDRAPERGVAARGRAAREPHRPRQHDGVHAPAGQSLPDRGGAGTHAGSRARAALRAQHALADGRAGARRIRDVGRDPGRAAGGGELHRRAAQPRFVAQPVDRRRALRRRRDGDAARPVRRAEVGLRRGAARHVPEGAAQD